jgi:hypothetical protein
MVKVPKEVVDERHERIHRSARKHGRIPSEEVLALAHWTIVVTNIARKRADYCQILVLLPTFRRWVDEKKDFS